MQLAIPPIVFTPSKKSRYETKKMDRDLYFLISRNELATSLKPSFMASIELLYSLGDGSSAQEF